MENQLAAMVHALVELAKKPNADPTVMAQTIKDAEELLASFNAKTPSSDGTLVLGDYNPAVRTVPSSTQTATGD